MVRLRYDQTADALYIQLADDAEVSRTERLEPGTLIDVDRQGRLVGIELIHPARSWPLDAIAERFKLADDDLDVLRSLWPGDGTYPFANPAELAVA